MKHLLKYISFGGSRYTIRAKFIVIFTLLIAVISAFIYFYFPLKLEREARMIIADEAQSFAEMTAFSVSSPLVFEDKKDMDEVFESVTQNKHVLYLIVHNHKGEVFLAFNQETAIEADYRFRSNKEPITKDGLIYRTITPILHNKKQIGRLFLGVSLVDLRALLKRSKSTITMLSATIFILGVLAVFFISTVITSPLKKMVLTIEQISRGDLSKRIILSSNDEVGDLAASFNLMVDNLEAYSKRMTELTDNLEKKVTERTKEFELEVNERRLAQEALEKSEEKYRRLVDNSLVGIYIIQDCLLKFCNQQYANIFGYQGPGEMLGKHMEELLTKESRNFLDHEASLKETNKKDTARFEFKGLKKDGTIIDIEVLENYIVYQGKPAVQGILIDITERKQFDEEKRQLEAQLQHVQKMESLGRLAGGIAHDFNNILSAVIGYAELTLNEVRKESKVAANLEQILAASNRAKDMIKQILIFSRKSEQERKPIMLADVVGETLKLMRSILPATIEIRQHLEVGLSPIMADASEMHQVIMNLCANASYAMRDKGGVLEVVLKEIEVGSEIIERIALRSGRYQQLTISDTGHGIPEEIKSRIFEPYYSTKKVGEGTGMGLAVVHGIIKSHEGEITVYSEPEKGTSFRIFLPVSDQQVVKAPVIERKKMLPRGSELILFIDDEPQLAELGKDMLELLGYKVIIRTCAIEAMEIFRKSPDQFNLIISDQTMPKMTGVQLANEVRKINPDIPVIVCSGFSETINEENYSSQGINAFIMKPIVRSDLAWIVRQVLDKKHPGH